MHFGGLAIGSLFKNSVGSYSTERIEQLHINLKAFAKDEQDETFTHIDHVQAAIKEKIRNMPITGKN